MKKSAAAWRPIRAPRLPAPGSPLCLNPFEQGLLWGPDDPSPREPETWDYVSNLAGVEAVVETWHPDPDTGKVDFGHAAWSMPPFGVAAHVTDDPGRVLEVLQSRQDLHKAFDRWTDLGSGGLFVSAVPQLWTGMARRKWSFLAQLDPRQRQVLAEALTEILVDQRRAPAYISQGEFETAVRDLDRYRVRGQDFAFGVVRLAEQPYNIRAWERSFLVDLGLPAGQQPVFVETVFCGAFARLNSSIDAETGAALRRNLSGAFMPGGWFETGQMVIWDATAIAKFGEWVNPEYEPTFAKTYQRPGWARGYLLGNPIIPGSFSAAIADLVDRPGPGLGIFGLLRLRELMNISRGEFGSEVGLWPPDLVEMRQLFAWASQAQRVWAIQSSWIHEPLPPQDVFRL